jgi:murein L,D-transpeptidase YafK
MIFSITYLLLNAILRDTSFLDRQLSFRRVDAAMEKNYARIEERCKKIGSDKFDEIYIRAFKAERVLEIWKRKENQFVLYDTFLICNISGELGPKKKQGDLQVPEGFYEINVFNPESNYLLSLGINYPNERDEIVNKPPRGGDIYIHGKCVSAGCLAMEDPQIEEIYSVALLAKAAGQEKIPVHIFPFKMNDKNMERYYTSAAQELKEFWKSLKPMFVYFEQKRDIPLFHVTGDGKYVVEVK